MENERDWIFDKIRVFGCNFKIGFQNIIICGVIFNLSDIKMRVKIVDEIVVHHKSKMGIKQDRGFGLFFIWAFMGYLVFLNIVIVRQIT